MKNVLKRVTRVGVYGPHTQVKCLLKGLNFGAHIRKHIDIFPDDMSLR